MNIALLALAFGLGLFVGGVVGGLIVWKRFKRAVGLAVAQFARAFEKVVEVLVPYAPAEAIQALESHMEFEQIAIAVEWEDF